jgi:hypothetical protein
MYIVLYKCYYKVIFLAKLVRMAQNGSMLQMLPFLGLQYLGKCYKMLQKMMKND